MATIRASCDTCGDVEFPTTDVRVHAPEDGGAGTYSFCCPNCHLTVVRPAERPVMDLLIAAGVAFTTWRRPAELVERELEVDDEPLTHNDLLSFHEQITDDATLEAALAAISDRRAGGSEPAR